MRVRTRRRISRTQAILTSPPVLLVVSKRVVDRVEATEEGEVCTITRATSACMTSRIAALTSSTTIKRLGAEEAVRQINVAADSLNVVVAPPAGPAREVQPAKGGRLTRASEAGPTSEAAHRTNEDAVAQALKEVAGLEDKTNSQTRPGTSQVHSPELALIAIMTKATAINSSHLATNSMRLATIVVVAEARSPELELILVLTKGTIISSNHLETNSVRLATTVVAAEARSPEVALIKAAAVSSSHLVISSIHSATTVVAAGALLIPTRPLLP